MTKLQLQIDELQIGLTNAIDANARGDPGTQPLAFKPAFVCEQPDPKDEGYDDHAPGCTTAPAFRGASNDSGIPGDHVGIEVSVQVPAEHGATASKPPQPAQATTAGTAATSAASCSYGLGAQSYYYVADGNQ